MSNRKPIVVDTTGLIGQIPDTDSAIILSATFIGNAILIPAANGAVQIGTSGNARGICAVDLQQTRLAVTYVASGSYSAVLSGADNRVISQYSVVCGGQNNWLDDEYSVIGGGVNNNIYDGSTNADGNVIAGGVNNEITGHGCSVGGGQHNHISKTFAAGVLYSTIAGGLENSIIGDYCTIGGGYQNTIPVNCGNYNTITGGYSNTTVAASTNNGSNVLGGYDNSIQGQYCVVAGGLSNDIVLAAGAIGSTIGGGYNNNISESYSTIAGGYENLIEATYCSIGGGTTNHIHGSDSSYSVICGGDRNTITNAAYASILGGATNSITGDYGSILGGESNSVTAEHGTCLGAFALASNYGQFAQASGQFTAVGDAQTSILVARCQTTNATQTEMFLDGSAQRLTILEKSTWYYTIKLIGRQTNSDYTVQGYIEEGIIKRDTGGNATITNHNHSIAFVNDANWAYAVSADTTNQALAIKVTGKASENISWVARIELVQVTG